MKKIHIVLIVIIAITIGGLIITLGNTSTYANFAEAQQNPDSEYHVVGKLNKTKATEYNPAVDADEFTFYMIDTKGEEKKVILHNTKPQDFERAEQIVIIGKMHEGCFHANEILMKCPSKYNDGKQVATAAVN
jgi:cytochrome c-type biogenesis protein CcmE